MIDCLRVLCAWGLLISVSYSQTHSVAKIRGDLRADETLAHSKLSPAELEEILKQVEDTAFDSPDNWRLELRARRVSLGASKGLVLEGSTLLCGGTGNCQLWVFRRVGQHWVNMFDDQAPMADQFQLEAGTHPIPDLFLCANTSANGSACELYSFNGKVYRRVECFHARDEETPTPNMRTINKIPCSQERKSD